MFDLRKNCCEYEGRIWNFLGPIMYSKYHICNLEEGLQYYGTFIFGYLFSERLDERNILFLNITTNQRPGIGLRMVDNKLFFNYQQNPLCSSANSSLRINKFLWQTCSFEDCFNVFIWVYRWFSVDIYLCGCDSSLPLRRFVLFLLL